MSQKSLDSPSPEMDTKDLRVKKKILKSKRRMRDASGDRNFTCGCRKAYLTYSSLYTHVKNKHGNIFPAGSIARVKIRMSNEEGFDSSIIPSVSKFYHEFNESMDTLVGATGKKSGLVSASMLLDIFDFKLTKKGTEFFKLRAAFDSLLNTNEESLENLRSSVNIYKVLAFYLISIYRFCSEKFFQEYVFLCILLCKGLNEKGDSLLASITRNYSQKSTGISFDVKNVNEKKKEEIGKDENKTVKEFCESLNVFMISEIMNVFLSELYPVYLNAMKTPQMRFGFLGLEMDQIPNLVFMVKMIANWLFHNELTDFKLEINADF